MLRLLIFLLLTLEGFGEHYCYFIPPPGWSVADPAKLSPRVKVCFVGKSSKGLAPSVNLAAEKVHVSLAAYLTAVKKLHEADPGNRFRDLGNFQNGRLVEIESKTSFGSVRRLQLILLQDKIAYVLTVGALKDEFSHHYQTFENVLSSLRITDDLISELPALKKAELIHLMGQVREGLIRACKIEMPPFNILTLRKSPLSLRKNNSSSRVQPPEFQEKIWPPFQQKIVTDFPELGPYWQALLLQNVHTRLTALL